MKMITPQIQFSTEDSYRQWQHGYTGTKSKMLTKHYKTYRELKKDLPRLLAMAYCPEEDENTVFVVRGKRGQWGEWCETWGYRNGVPTIIKQGWS
jgi:hypothetical protein